MLVCGNPNIAKESWNEWRMELKSRTSACRQPLLLFFLLFWNPCTLHPIKLWGTDPTFVIIYTAYSMGNILVSWRTLTLPAYMIKSSHVFQPRFGWAVWNQHAFARAWAAPKRRRGCHKHCCEQHPWLRSIFPQYTYEAKCFYWLESSMKAA
jgi:hypothetical protein